VTKRTNRFVIAALAAAIPCGQAAATQTYGLEQLRALARVANPNLVSARAAVEAAEAAVERQRVFDDPVAGLRSDWAESVSDSGSEWRVELSQRIPLPGHRRARIDTAEAALERARYDQLALAALLEYETGRLWAEALLAKQSLGIAAQNEEIARRLLEIVERRVEAGEAAPLEAVKARTEWFSRRRLSQDLKRRLAETRAALDILCHRSLGRSFVLAGDLEHPRDLPPVESLLAHLESSNSELQVVRAAGAEAEAVLATERKAIIPDIELSIGRESELDKEATGGGIAFRLPIWNRNRPAVAAAEAHLDSARARIDARRLDLEMELEEAVLAYRSAAQHLGLYEGGWRESAARAVEIAEFSYENGESSLLDLLDAQRSLLEVGLTEIEARARLTLARLDIERLLGLSLEEVESHESH